MVMLRLFRIYLGIDGKTGKVQIMYFFLNFLGKGLYTCLNFQNGTLALPAFMFFLYLSDSKCDISSNYGRHVFQKTPRPCIGYIKGKVFPLQARCSPEGGYRCTSTPPRPQR